MIGFISDIHGNYPALTAVIGALDALGVKTVYSLGDVAGYYPMINECAALLRERRILNLKGNHDRYLADGAACGRSRSAETAIEYQKRVITPENSAWLKRSLPCFDEPRFFAVHGGIDDYVDEYTESPVFPEEIGQPLFLCGHTHKQLSAARGDRRFCNPGSVGQPRDKDPRAAFAVLTGDGEVRLFRREYDIDRTAWASKKAGFEERFYAGLYSGEPIAAKKE